jgi:non-specific protein-tyrosine kinase
LLPVTDGAVVSALADGVLLVVQVKKTKREQLTASLDALRAVEARPLGVVLNRVPEKGPDSNSYAYGYAMKGLPRLEDTSAPMRPAARRAPERRHRAPVSQSTGGGSSARPREAGRYDEGPLRPPVDQPGYAAPADHGYREHETINARTGGRRLPASNGYDTSSQPEAPYDRDAPR